MTTVAKSFTAAGVGDAFSLEPNQQITYSASGTFTGFVELQRSKNNGATWERVTRGAVDTGISGTVKNESPKQVRYRFAAFDTDSETPVTGTIVTSLADVVDTLYDFKHPQSGVSLFKITEEGIETPKITPDSVARTAQKRIASAFNAKVGSAAGWVVGAADDVGLTTLPASQTDSKLVVPITGLKVGDTITGFHLIGQVESAGGHVLVDADLRKHTAAAADVADASVGAITQLDVVADTILSASNARKASLTEVVGANETFYVVITATTAAATDIALQGVAVEVTEA